MGEAKCTNGRVTNSRCYFTGKLSSDGYLAPAKRLIFVSTFVLPYPLDAPVAYQVRDVIRTKHYLYRTKQIYVQWIYRYIIFHNKRHPKDMGVPEIEIFLTD